MNVFGNLSNKKCSNFRLLRKFLISFSRLNASNRTTTVRLNVPVCFALVWLIFTASKCHFDNVTAIYHPSQSFFNKRINDFFLYTEYAQREKRVQFFACSEKREVKKKNRCDFCHCSLVSTVNFVVFN